MFNLRVCTEIKEGRGCTQGRRVRAVRSEQREWGSFCSKLPSEKNMLNGFGEGRCGRVERLETKTNDEKLLFHEVIIHLLC